MSCGEGTKLWELQSKSIIPSACPILREKSLCWQAGQALSPVVQGASLAGAGLISAQTGPLAAWCENVEHIPKSSAAARLHWWQERERSGRRSCELDKLRGATMRKVQKMSHKQSCLPLKFTWEMAELVYSCFFFHVTHCKSKLNESRLGASSQWWCRTTVLGGKTSLGAPPCPAAACLGTQAVCPV